MMSRNIKQLRNLWEKEKEEYKTQEVGSGVQRFIRHHQIYFIKEI